jgi:hypothetical protein
MKRYVHAAGLKWQENSRRTVLLCKAALKRPSIPLSPDVVGALRCDAARALPFTRFSSKTSEANQINKNLFEFDEMPVIL